MALVLAVAHLLGTLAILAVLVAWGSQMLDRLDLAPESRLESVLFAAGFSFVSLEVVLFALSAAGWLRFESALALLALMGLSAGSGWRRAWNDCWALATNIHASLKSWVDRAIAAGVAAFSVLAALIAMAPLTGSDAMNYHFTAPLLEQGHRLRPIFWLATSFYIGQSHLLISLGLALGSDRISLGLIYLGGLLTASALFAMARQLMPHRWAWIATLLFVATPLVFWQVSTSGSPDIWMGFFILLTVLAAARGLEPSEAARKTLEAKKNRWVVLAGYFAGGAAGVKYTGWIIPFALVVYLLVTRRSLSLALRCGVASLVAGVWPLARNWIWTGDPVFPFLTDRLAPALANPYALTAIKSMASAADFGRDLPHLLKFPFALVLHGESYGLGQYFGPFVLAFAPLLFFARWERPVARLGAMFWGITFAAILFSNQMGRFLLPVHGLALVLVFSGVASIGVQKRRIVAVCCSAMIVLFLPLFAVVDALYAKNFLPVVLGAESERAFLERMAPDYQTDEFIERTLRPELSRQEGGRVMVFYRHLYYLHVPFVAGPPETSWVMNPSACSNPEALLALLDRLDVRWIAKAPDYPEALEKTFSQMQRDGQLVPVASADVENLTGSSRIYRQTERLHVVLLKVNGT